MTRDHHHLATTNAPRTCGGCGAAATVYDHAVGFRCGACGDYPDGRRGTDYEPMTHDTTDTDRTDAQDDPAACSLCGTHIGAFGGEYCDPCAREIGAKEPLRTCLECGQRAPGEQMTSIDVSPPDEYYPEMKYLCQGCAGGDE